MQYFVIVLLDGWCWEEASFGNVNDPLSNHASVFVKSVSILLFNFDVVFQVKKRHEPVFVDQFIVKTFQAFFLTYCKNSIADDKVNQRFDGRA